VATPIVELLDLTKIYDNKVVVDHLNLSISKGEVFGLLGPNGAGKSTTILMILGLSEPTSGIVNVCGINSLTDPVKVKQRVGYLPEDVGFYDNLSGKENLIYTAQLNGFNKNEAIKKADNLLLRVGLMQEADKKVGKYSRGMRQRLGLADALIKNPEVIILDEPTLGIDPSGMRDFLQLIVELSKEDNITVIFSSHHLHQIQQVCDRVGIFVNGKLIAEGNIKQLSEKIFGENFFNIEFSIQENKENSNIEQIKEKVFKLLKSIKEVKNIDYDKNVFKISSDKDITSKIAKEIIENKLELTSLNKKEYGLDDIYYRYFLGGENNEHK